MKRLEPLVRSLWLPLLVAVGFLTAGIYQQEILLRLGSATLDQVMRYFPFLLGIGIWLSLAYLVNRMIGVMIWDPLNRRVPLPKLIRDVAGVIIYSLAVTGIVGVVFDKPVGPFWAASGAGAIVIGLALRNVILDIFLGLAVNFDRPFEIGHFIQIANGPSGRVVELNWRTTRLLTGEGNLVVIPNGRLGEVIVTNFSKPEPLGEFEISVFIDFEVPTDRALRVLNAAVRTVAGETGIQAEPPPKARIRGVSAQGVEYKIKYVLDPRQAGPGKARHAVWKAVLDQLHRAGLQPATTRQDVFHAPRPQRQLDTRALADRVALLSRVELFQGLTDDERAFLSGRMTERTVREGASVIKRGEDGESMFIVCEGLLHVFIAIGTEQRETQVAKLQAGVFFGEMSALTGERRSATIVAATDCVLFEITKDDLAALLERRPEIAETLGEALAARKRRNAEAQAKGLGAAAVAPDPSVAAQFVGRILSFFGLTGKTSRLPVAVNDSRTPFT
jgi:small-conductance mechanosensitive channel/CRP-like cAMP-binding protein